MTQGNKIVVLIITPIPFLFPYVFFTGSHEAAAIHQCIGFRDITANIIFCVPFVPLLMAILPAETKFTIYFIKKLHHLYFLLLRVMVAVSRYSTSETKSLLGDPVCNIYYFRLESINSRTIPVVFAILFLCPFLPHL